jgi:hypothetical protein
VRDLGLALSANSVLPSAISRPSPCDRSVALGLEGGYVRKWTDRKTNFELIAGRSIAEEREPRYLGPHHSYERRPKRSLFDVLKSQALQANQDVTPLTDSGDEVGALTEFVTPAGEHVLDWFHITMRVTLLTQFIGGVAQQDGTNSAELLWHGNPQRTPAVNRLAP